MGAVRRVVVKLERGRAAIASLVHDGVVVAVVKGIETGIRVVFGRTRCSAHVCDSPLRS